MNQKDKINDLHSQLADAHREILKLIDSESGYYMDRLPFNLLFFKESEPSLQASKNGAAYYCSDKNTFLSIDVVALAFCGKKLNNLVGFIYGNACMEDNLKYILKSKHFESTTAELTFQVGPFRNEKTAGHFPFACNEMNYYNDNINLATNICLTNQLVSYSHSLYFLINFIDPNKMFMKSGVDIDYNDCHEWYINAQKALETVQYFIATIEQLKSLDIDEIQRGHVNVVIDREYFKINTDI